MNDPWLRDLRAYLKANAVRLAFIIAFLAVVVVVILIIA